MAEKEYIEREAAFNAILNLAPKVDDDGYCWVIRGDAARAIGTIPAADVRPVVKGFNKLKDYPTLFECSACGWECDDTMPGDTTTYNFCPNCGAMMGKDDGQTDDND